jgi:aspartyl-tRNA(Asn)/glutamyl-tRNA(Gln) amidotransferase subunit C
MSIEKQTIENLASLARIAIDDKQIDEVSQRLQSVLKLVDQLQAADTSSLAGNEQSQQTQRLRDDDVTETDQRNELQAIAPETEEGLFLVPKVID